MNKRRSLEGKPLRAGRAAGSVRKSYRKVWAGHGAQTEAEPTGRGGSSPCQRYNFKQNGRGALKKDITRRRFLQLSGIAAIGLSAAPLVEARRRGKIAGEPRVIYRLSLRGRRGSQAAKRHNANMLFATRQAANMNRAHPGDNSRIVELTVSQAEFFRLFASRNSPVADLRKIKANASAAWSQYT